MSFHALFGRHRADLANSHWDCGHFVSRCTVCDREMIKLPGLPWRMRAGSDGVRSSSQEG